MNRKKTYRSGGDVLDKLSDFFAGFADSGTFNLTGRIRRGLGIDDLVNYDSGYYTGGAVTGTVVTTAATAGNPCGAMGLGIKSLNFAQLMGNGMNMADHLEEGSYGSALLDAFGMLGNLSQLSKSCFAAGTPLLTPEGSKAIEGFQVGDWILSAPESDPNAPIQARRVEEVFQRVSPLIELQVGGRSIKTTVEHPFYVDGNGWTQAGALSAGNLLRSRDGRCVAVEAVNSTDEVAEVYNLRIEEYHTYFVGAVEWGFAVWAHNTDYIVKGGTGKSWHIDTFEEEGVTISGSSASSESGKTIEELSESIKNNQIRVAKVEDITNEGGHVLPTRRTPENPYHVTITDLEIQDLDRIFDPPIKKPT